MSTAQNKVLVRRFLDEVISKASLAVADELCAANFAWHGAGVADVPDLATFKQLLPAFFAAFPDLTVTPEDLVAEGDRVVARYTWRGTHQGEFQGLSPTGRNVTVRGVGIFHIASGKIVEEWWQEDLLGLLRQLEAIPAAGQVSVPGTDAP